jgi:hypothetical protein
MFVLAIRIHFLCFKFGHSLSLCFLILSDFKASQLDLVSLILSKIREHKVWLTQIKNNWRVWRTAFQALISDNPDNLDCMHFERTRTQSNPLLVGMSLSMCPYQLLPATCMALTGILALIRTMLEPKTWNLESLETIFTCLKEWCLSHGCSSLVLVQTLVHIHKRKASMAASGSGAALFWASTASISCQMEPKSWS